MQVCPPLRSFPKTMADTVLVLHAALGDDGRGLAAEFEGDGDEVLARRLHHRSSHGGAPGEDEVIERQEENAEPSPLTMATCSSGRAR